MSRLRDKSIPIISNPPVDPLQLKTRPIPAPAITPPKIEDNNGSVATTFTGT